MVSDGRRKSNHFRLRKEKFELDNKGGGRNVLSRASERCFEEPKEEFEVPSLQRGEIKIRYISDRFRYGKYHLKF